MKRYIRSWSTAEPSSVEYGEMTSAWRNRLATRYEPFIVTPTYWTRGKANSDGYRIVLPVNPDSVDVDWIEDCEWFAKDNGLTFSSEITLYGPFNRNEINGRWAEIFKHEPLKKFPNGKIDNVMDYLFKTVDFEEYGYDE